MNTEAQMEALTNEAREIDANHEQTKGIVLKDPTLSEQGKRERLNNLESKRQAAVQELADRGEKLLETIEQTLVTEKRRAEKAVIERKRTALGDSVYSELNAREAAHMASDEIVAKLAVLKDLNEAEPDENTAFALELFSSIALIESMDRIDGNLIAAALDTGKPERIKELEWAVSNGERWLNSLDQQAHRQYLADAMGVDPRYIPA